MGATEPAQIAREAPDGLGGAIARLEALEARQAGVEAAVRELTAVAVQLVTKLDNVERLFHEVKAGGLKAILTGRRGDGG